MEQEKNNWELALLSCAPTGLKKWRISRLIWSYDYKNFMFTGMKIENKVKFGWILLFTPKTSTKHVVWKLTCNFHDSSILLTEPELYEEFNNRLIPMKQIIDQKDIPLPLRECFQQTFAFLFYRRTSISNCQVFEGHRYNLLSMYRLRWRGEKNKSNDDVEQTFFPRFFFSSSSSSFCIVMLLANCSFFFGEEHEQTLAERKQHVNKNFLSCQI